MQRLPNVLSASLTTHTPLNGSLWSEPIVRAGEPQPERDTAFAVAASPHFFATMQIPLLSRRDFNDRDTPTSPPVAVVNEAFAQKYFAGTNPIGQRLSAGLRGKPRELEIVGVAKNTNNVALRRAPTATVYLAFQQFDSGFSATSLVARVRSSAAADTAGIRQMLQAQLPDTVLEVRPMSAQVASTIVQERMLATLAGGFGVLALMLACVGLYGLLAYSVTQRIKEIGIRMALGSTQRSIVALVLNGAVRLVARWHRRWTSGSVGGFTLGRVAALWRHSYGPAHGHRRHRPADRLRTTGSISASAARRTRRSACGTAPRIGTRRVVTTPGGILFSRSARRVDPTLFRQRFHGFSRIPLAAALTR